MDQPALTVPWTGTLGKPADPSRDIFRHNLARIMAEKNVTQAGLARSMDVSRVAVHAWIWGTCFPETSRLLRLAQVLAVSVGTLLDQPGALDPTDTTNEEALLLDAFRRLPSTARLTLLADAYEMTAALAVKVDGQPEPGGTPPSDRRSSRPS